MKGRTGVFHCANCLKLQLLSLSPRPRPKSNKSSTTCWQPRARAVRACWFLLAWSWRASTSRLPKRALAACSSPVPEDPNHSLVSAALVLCVDSTGFMTLSNVGNCEAFV